MATVHIAIEIQRSTLYLITLVYSLIGVGFGVACWRGTAGTWMRGSLAQHVARCVVLTLCVALLWPGFLVLLLLCLTSPGRAFINQFLFGSRDGAGQW